MFKGFCQEGRIPAIDFIKLFASFLVIMGHCIWKYVDSPSANPLYNFIWLTQMPLFMFASGFVNDKPERFLTLKLFFKRLLKNVLLLLVPCLTYLFVTCLIDNKNIISAFILFYKDPQTNLWFLWVLFIIHLFFNLGLYFSNKFNNKIRPIIPVAFIFFVVLLIVFLMLIIKDSFDFNILSLKLFAYYAPFYCFGFAFHHLLNTKIMDKKPAKIGGLIVVSISLIVVVFECVYFKSIYSFDDSNLNYMFCRVIGSIASIIVCSFVSDLLVRLRVLVFVSKYGAFSLQSYYLHLVFIRFLSYSSNIVWEQWLISFGTVLLLVTMVGITLFVMYFIPYLHLILFGRSFSYYKFEKKLPAIFL